jgi:DNA-binding transcriptional MerR regulator
LSIGELSEHTGVPANTLRYYDALGLVRPAARVAGRRRYAAAAVRDVGLIVFFRDIGFSLAEFGHFIAGEQQSRRALIDHKLAELAEQQHRIEVARRVLEHGRRCPAREHMKCPGSGRSSMGNSVVSRWKKATPERTDKPRTSYRPLLGREGSRPAQVVDPFKGEIVSLLTTDEDIPGSTCSRSGGVSCHDPTRRSRVTPLKEETAGYECG